MNKRNEFELEDTLFTAAKQDIPSDAHDLKDFDFQRCYGSDDSDTKSSRSARPDSCIRPYSCGFATSGDSKDEEEYVEDAMREPLDSAWWSASVLGTETDSICTASEHDPFEIDHLEDADSLSGKQDSVQAMMNIEKLSQAVPATQSTSEKTSSDEFERRDFAVPQIQIEGCDADEVQVASQPPAIRESCMRQHQQVNPRSVVVSFAAEESIITFNSAEAAEDSDVDDEPQSEPDNDDLHSTEPSRLSCTSLSPTPPSVSRQSMAALPTWASVYYKRGSTCLTQLARRSTIKWGAKYAAGEESESLVEQASQSGVESSSRTIPIRSSVACDRAIARPTNARTSRQLRKSTFRCSSRISELSWKPELKQAIEVPLKTHFEHASFAKPQTSIEAARLLRKIILIFSFGFLFPPLWFWGCLLHASAVKQRDHNHGAADDAHYATRRINQWRMACAVMLGVTILMITICAIVALTMKDLR